MNLDSIKAFCIVVEAGSISKAAKKLFVSQPSLSVKIRDLETYYQATLLERTHKGIRPTEAGLVVYQHAQKMLCLGENLERELDKNRGDDQKLIIGASSTIGNFALPCTIYNFQEKYPNYRIAMSISNSEQVIDSVMNKRADMGLVEGPLSETMLETLAGEGIKTRRVTTNELVLVVPNNEHWSTKSTLFEKDFTTLPLILREKGSGIRTTLEMTLAAHGIMLDRLNVIMELNTTNAIVSAVTSEKGVSLLPKMAVRKELHYNILKQVHVENIKFKHDFTTLYHSEDAKQSLHAAFLNFLYSRERGFC
jgi:DNA-binding transcriptional LysR family regulator